MLASVEVVPGTGIEPACPLCRKAADFKSDVSTNFTTRAHDGIVSQKWHPVLRSWRASRVFWRRDPESNRANRICNPVHNRFAIAPMCFAPFDCKRHLQPTKKGSLGFPLWNLEREKSLELSTSTLARLRSTN